MVYLKVFKLVLLQFNCVLPLEVDVKGYKKMKKKEHKFIT